MSQIFLSGGEIKIRANGKWKPHSDGQKHFKRKIIPFPLDGKLGNWSVVGLKKNLVCY